MNNPTLLCGVVALCWALAPMLGRMSSVNAMMLAVLVAAGSLIAALPVAFSQNYAAVGSRAIILGLVTGIVNGIGLIAFYRLVAGSSEGLWEASRVLPIAYVLVPVGIAILARLFFGEVVTTNKVIGLALAGGAIWFLNK